MKYFVLFLCCGLLVRGLVVLMMGLFLVILYVNVQQCNLLQKIGYIVLDELVVSYCFECFVVDSLDQQCCWWVNLVILVRVGKILFLVLYVLDGNVVVMVLDQLLLVELVVCKVLLVLVLIGYDNDLCIDFKVCICDYIVWIDCVDDESGMIQVVGGGVVVFFDVIECCIKLEVECCVCIDMWQQVLWGYLLGGLFVFNVLYM